jgi:hypothetical protein
VVDVRRVAVESGRGSRDFGLERDTRSVRGSSVLNSEASLVSFSKWLVRLIIGIQLCVDDMIGFRDTITNNNQDIPLASKSNTKK